MSLRCGMCGCKDFEPRTAKGRTFPYMDLDIVCPEDFFLRTCKKCGNQIINSREILELDAILEQAYQDLKRTR